MWPCVNYCMNVPSGINLLEKKLDVNYTRMQRAVLSKSTKQQPIKKVAVWTLTSHLKNYQSKTIKIYWRSKDEVKSNVLR